MAHFLKTLGYFIFDHSHEKEGFAETSLENLVAAGHESKLPFLDAEKLGKLQDRKGVPKKTIADVPLPEGPDKLTWSATSRFLFQMKTNGRFGELGISPTRMLVTANRKTIERIIQFVRSKNSKTRTAKIRTKMESRIYGKVLLLSYENKKLRDYYLKGYSENTLFGLNFNFYLLKPSGADADVKNEQEICSSWEGYTLFSIHLLEIGNTCLVYEAQIDAIDRTREEENGPWKYSIVEVKSVLEKYEKDIVEKFQKYSDIFSMSCEGRENNAVLSPLQRARVLSKRNIDDNDKPTMNLSPHILQGELGHVNMFVYGFTKKLDWRGEYVTAEEFPWYPHQQIHLNRQIGYLVDFVALLENTHNCDLNAGIYWDEWETWQIRREDEALRVYQKQDLLGELKLWSVVESRFSMDKKRKNESGNETQLLLSVPKERIKLTQTVKMFKK